MCDEIFLAEYISRIGGASIPTAWVPHVDRDFEVIRVMQRAKTRRCAGLMLKYVEKAGMLLFLQGQDYGIDKASMVGIPIFLQRVFRVQNATIGMVWELHNEVIVPRKLNWDAKGIPECNIGNKKNWFKHLLCTECNLALGMTLDDQVVILPTDDMSIPHFGWTAEDEHRMVMAGRPPRVMMALV